MSDTLITYITVVSVALPTLGMVFAFCRRLLRTLSPLIRMPEMVAELVAIKEETRATKEETIATKQELIAIKQETEATKENTARTNGKLADVYQRLIVVETRLTDHIHGSRLGPANNG